MKTLILIIGIFIGTFIGMLSMCLIQINRERKLDAFDKKYKELQDEVDDLPITFDNFNYLLSRFEDLRQEPTFELNKEKYHVLKDRFLNRFGFLPHHHYLWI